MLYTIKDLSEGKCAVRNDGTVEELREVIKLAFPKDLLIKHTKFTYYYKPTYLEGRWAAVNGVLSIPTQSVKDFLVETKYKGKAVHCETQEQWDFAAKKLNRTSSVKYKDLGDSININNPNSSNYKQYWKNSGYQILSFQEWLDENGYVFGDEPKFIEGTWYESDCGMYYGKFLNENRGYSYPDEFPSKEYINTSSSTFYNDGGCFSISTFSKAKLAPMEKVNKYLPKRIIKTDGNISEKNKEAIRLEAIEFDKTYKKHSYKDYKEGDYVVITEAESTTFCNDWFMPGEVLKLGGKYWDGSIKKLFTACTINEPEGNGMDVSFEENYKIRKATQEEIDNSQWGNKMTESNILDQVIFEPHQDLEEKYMKKNSIQPVEWLNNIVNKAEVIRDISAKNKLETIKVKRRSIIK